VKRKLLKQINADAKIPKVNFRSQTAPSGCVQPHGRREAFWVCINTDQVLFSFVVIFAPQTDRITNLLTLFERSSDSLCNCG